MSFWGNNKKAQKEDIELFNPTKRISNFIWLDYDNKLFMVSTKMNMKPKYLIKFCDLKGFSFFEDDREVTKNGGVTRAIAGGLIFGGPGAIVGAMTGKSKDISYTKNMWISLEISDAYENQHSVIIPFIMMNKTKKNSLLYRELNTRVKEILIELENIIGNKDNSNKKNDEADEIRKFKLLLDEGIITQEEFNEKKKQILNM